MKFGNHETVFKQFNQIRTTDSLFLGEVNLSGAMNTKSLICQSRQSKFVMFLLFNDSFVLVLQNIYSIDPFVVWNLTNHNLLGNLGNIN